MPIVSTVCPSCNAPIQVDNSKDAAICPYCKAPYVVEKAINNYNVTNNINADVVNVYGAMTSDFVIKAGVLMEYNGSATKVEIPYGVKSIVKAFSDCYELTEVVIPDSVTTIGAYAFSNCNLENVYFEHNNPPVELTYAFNSTPWAARRRVQAWRESGV